MKNRVGTEGYALPDSRIGLYDPVFEPAGDPERELSVALSGTGGNQAPEYLDGILTASSLRPFLRRRLSISRPHLVSMRARKPCLRTLLVLWGLYVGLPMVVTFREVLENESGYDSVQL